MVRERIQSLAKVMSHLERGQFKWNNIYLATTSQLRAMPAVSPAATLFFRDDENRILVGTGRENRLHCF